MRGVPALKTQQTLKKKPRLNKVKEDEGKPELQPTYQNVVHLKKSKTTDMEGSPS